MKAKPNGELKIERGIPIPRRERSGVIPDALRKMKVGDSVLVPRKITGMHGYLRDVIRTEGRHDWKFICRTVDGGVRVWRVA